MCVLKYAIIVESEPSMGEYSWTHKYGNPELIKTCSTYFEAEEYCKEIIKEGQKYYISKMSKIITLEKKPVIVEEYEG